jgi:hypothetical protein
MVWNSMVCITLNVRFEVVIEPDQHEVGSRSASIQVQIIQLPYNSGFKDYIHETRCS